MSLPKDLLDQLLSGYLDDALSADERDRVEQLMESDPEIADELDQLRGLKKSLKAVAKADSSYKLESGFADRVLDAAVARAHAEGLSDDHPLVRLAEQPSTASAPADSSPSWRNAGVLVGLAASIALAVFVLRPEPRDPQGIVVADVDPVADPGIQPAPVIGEEQTAIAMSDDAATDSGERIPDNSDVEPAPEMVANSTPTPANVASPATVASDSDPKPAVGTIAKAESDVPDSMEVPTQFGAIFVVDVRRTEAGRASSAVRTAMRRASIDTTGKKEVTEQVAGFVNETAEALSEEEEVSVLYLQMPGKKFDAFYQSLWADQDGIASIRMTIAFDAPLTKVVDSIQIDPTTVRSNGAAFELLSQDGAVDGLVQRLDQLPFPASQDRGGAAPTSSTGTGPDVPAQVLVLVR